MWEKVKVRAGDYEIYKDGKLVGHVTHKDYFDFDMPVRNWFVDIVDSGYQEHVDTLKEGIQVIKDSAE